MCLLCLSASLVILSMFYVLLKSSVQFILKGIRLQHGLSAGFFQTVSCSQQGLWIGTPPLQEYTDNKPWPTEARLALKFDTHIISFINNGFLLIQLYHFYESSHPSASMASWIQDCPQPESFQRHSFPLKKRRFPLILQEKTSRPLQISLILACPIWN